MNTNTVVISGNIGNTPEPRVTPRSNTPTTRVALGQTEFFWKDEERQERTHWFYITFYGRLAEIVVEHLDKGAGIVVTGRLHTRPWKDKDLEREMMVTEVVAQSLEITRWPKEKDDAFANQLTEGNATQPSDTYHEEIDNGHPIPF